jgi:hypothetical protein
MRSVLRFTFVLAAAAMAAGCLEVRQDFTLNPDGAGKVVMDIISSDVSGAPPRPGGDRSPEGLARATVREMISQSRGVDAWADVSYDFTDDGRTHIRATAYFKELSGVRIMGPGYPLATSFAKDAAGGLVLTVGTGESPRAGPAEPPKLTDAQIAEAIKAQREKHATQRLDMAKYLAKSKFDLTYRLPGKVSELTNFRKEPDGSLHLVIEGAKLLQALDQLVADDASMREVVRAGRDINRDGPGANPEALNEKLFGARAPIRARVTGETKPLFDYEAGVKAARENYLKMRERLGLDEAPAAPAP